MARPPVRLRPPHRDQPAVRDRRGPGVRRPRAGGGAAVPALARLPARHGAAVPAIRLFGQRALRRAARRLLPDRAPADARRRRPGPARHERHRGRAVRHPRREHRARRPPRQHDRPPALPVPHRQPPGLRPRWRAGAGGKRLPGRRRLPAFRQPGPGARDRRPHRRACVRRHPGLHRPHLRGPGLRRRFLRHHRPGDARPGGGPWLRRPARHLRPGAAGQHGVAPKRPADRHRRPARHPPPAGAAGDSQQRHPAAGRLVREHAARAGRGGAAPPRAVRRVAPHQHPVRPGHRLGGARPAAFGPRRAARHRRHAGPRHLAGPCGACRRARPAGGAGRRRPCAGTAAPVG